MYIYLLGRASFLSASTGGIRFAQTPRLLRGDAFSVSYALQITMILLLTSYNLQSLKPQTYHLITLCYEKLWCKIVDASAARFNHRNLQRRRHPECNERSLGRAMGCKGNHNLNGGRTPLLRILTVAQILPWYSLRRTRWWRLISWVSSVRKTIPQRCRRRVGQV